MPFQKVDKVKVNQLLRQGKTQAEIARQLNVSKAAVSKALKRLKLSVVKNVTLESAHKVVNKNLNAIDQLYHINEVANKIIDELTGEQETTNRMVQAVQAVLAYEQEPTKDKLKDLKAIILRINGDKNTAIKACGEIRGQLGLQLDIFKTLYDVEAIAEFQRVVLDTIAEEKPKVRNAIIKRLKDRSALRRSVSIY